MKRLFWAAGVLGLASACGGAAATADTASVSPVAAAPPGTAVGLRADNPPTALVGSSVVAMDGVAEGLAWPALRAAVNRKPGDHAPLAIAVPRDVLVSTVLRAAWTLRDADLQIVTPDAAGTPRVLPLHPKPDSASPGCHLAVFLSDNGDLRVAYPGGPRGIAGADAAGELARALADESAKCAIRYVAFGAERETASWGAVFDLAERVDREKSAGDARYVLAEPVGASTR
jgi:hypothetical protein